MNLLQIATPTSQHREPNALEVLRLKAWYFKHVGMQLSDDAVNEVWEEVQTKGWGCYDN